MVDSTIDSPPLDAVDRAILRRLQQDGRISHAALAEAVGLTATPLRQRIDKLERAGVIQGYVALVDPPRVGRGVTAFVHVTLSGHALPCHAQFLERVTPMPDVLEIHHLTGEEDFLLKVVARDIAALEHFLLRDLTTVPGLGRVKTTLVLSSAKSLSAIPIDELAPEPGGRASAGVTP
jgi:Lrp/AsnC family transcriptional regulator, leucine-responsive regulatory protein